MAKHRIYLEYDEESDHFLVGGSLPSQPAQFHVTGYKASQVFHLFEQELMWNVEQKKRQERKPT